MYIGVETEKIEFKKTTMTTSKIFASACFPEKTQWPS